MLLSIILLAFLIIFASFTSLSIHPFLYFIRTGIIGSVSFIFFLSCLSIFFFYGVSFFHCFLRYIAKLVPFFSLFLVCSSFYSVLSPSFLNNFSYCINLISDAGDRILSTNVIIHNPLCNPLGLFWQYKFM